MASKEPKTETAKTPAKPAAESVVAKVPAAPVTKPVVAKPVAEPFVSAPATFPDAAAPVAAKIEQPAPAPVAAIEKAAEEFKGAKPPPPAEKSTK